MEKDNYVPVMVRESTRKALADFKYKLRLKSNPDITISSDYALRWLIAQGLTKLAETKTVAEMTARNVPE